MNWKTLEDHFSGYGFRIDSNTTGYEAGDGEGFLLCDDSDTVWYGKFIEDEDGISIPDMDNLIEVDIEDYIE